MTNTNNLVERVRALKSRGVEIELHDGNSNLLAKNDDNSLSSLVVTLVDNRPVPRNPEGMKLTICSLDGIEKAIAAITKAEREIEAWDQYLVQTFWFQVLKCEVS